MQAKKVKEAPAAAERKKVRKLRSVPLDRDPSPGAYTQTTVVKFEVYGQELVEKEVRPSGNSGRVYLPPDWIGHQVKIIRVD